MTRFIISMLFSIWCFTGLYAYDASRTYTVAFSQDTFDNDFRLNQVKEVETYFKQYSNIKFIATNAQANASVQVQQIENLIRQKVDVLLVSPYDEAALTPVVSKAYRSGIPVVMVDRTIKGKDYTAYVHPDNKQIAIEAARYLVKKLNHKGKVLLLKGVPNADPTRKRTEGFYQVVSKHPGIEVIERTANYLRRDAVIEMEKLVMAGEKFDGIMSQSDSMLVGARLVLKANQIDVSKMVTVGIDYIKPAQKAIRKGLQDSSFVYALCGKESAEIAMRILRGEKVPKEVNIKTVQVTQENVDDVKPIF